VSWGHTARGYAKQGEVHDSGVTWVQITSISSYVKDDFMKYLKAEVTKEQYRDLAKGLSKIVLVKSSSGYL
jgi:hypothetical protein